LFDIVFVSGDTDEESFNEYYKQMPWKAIPYESNKPIFKFSMLNLVGHVSFTVKKNAVLLHY